MDLHSTTKHLFTMSPLDGRISRGKWEGATKLRLSARHPRGIHYLTKATPPPPRVAINRRATVLIWSSALTRVSDTRHMFSMRASRERRTDCSVAVFTYSNFATPHHRWFDRAAASFSSLPYFRPYFLPEFCPRPQKRITRSFKLLPHTFTRRPRGACYVAALPVVVVVVACA